MAEPDRPQNVQTSADLVTVVATKVEDDGSCRNEDLIYYNTSCIGQGSFGTVYSATLQNGNTLVAIKKVSHFIPTRILKLLTIFIGSSRSSFQKS